MLPDNRNDRPERSLRNVALAESRLKAVAIGTANVGSMATPF